MSKASSRSPQRKPESHRTAARVLASRPVSRRQFCTCRCHTGYSRAHFGVKCTCKGGEGFMAKPNEQVFHIRISRRVLTWLEGTGAWYVCNDPEHHDYQEAVAKVYRAVGRKDGSVTVEVNRQEALELAERGDDLVVASGDGASSMVMGMGDPDQVDALADMNAGRALVKQVHWKLSEADGTLRVER